MNHNSVECEACEVFACCCEACSFHYNSGAGCEYCEDSIACPKCGHCGQCGRGQGERKESARRKISVDPKVWELAVRFIKDSPISKDVTSGELEEMTDCLAGEIQVIIEAWIEAAEAADKEDSDAR